MQAGANAIRVAAGYFHGVGHFELVQTGVEFTNSGCSQLSGGSDLNEFQSTERYRTFSTPLALKPETSLAS